MCSSEQSSSCIIIRGSFVAGFILSDVFMHATISTFCSSPSDVILPEVTVSRAPRRRCERYRLSFAARSDLFKKEQMKKENYCRSLLFVAQSCTDRWDNRENLFCSLRIFLSYGCQHMLDEFFKTDKRGSH